jgi:hypothetical protein
MSHFPHAENPDQADEVLLRTALVEHAPQEVDLAGGWAAVSARITLSAARSTAPVVGRGRFWRRPVPLAAAALVVAVLLMGAGYVGGRYLWAGPFSGSELDLIGDKHLYTAINQSATAGGVTITVIYAYADEGRTLIAYTLKPSGALRQRYMQIVVASYDLTDQFGEEPAGGNTQCTPLPSDGGPMQCLMDMPAFTPPTAASDLVVTWKISTLYLLTRSGGTDTSTTGWTLSFTLPFHHTNNGPGGPFAQPTHTTATG